MFITNNHDSFHLRWKKNLVKHQKVSKYYDQDCSGRMSSFITDETINLSLKILKSSTLPGIALRPIPQYSHHKKNFILILYSSHHLTTVYGKSLNKVFMLPSLVVACKLKWYNCFQNIQVLHTFQHTFLSWILWGRGGGVVGWGWEGDGGGRWGWEGGVILQFRGKKQIGRRKSRLLEFF